MADARLVNLVRAVRINQDMTQKQFAEALGCSWMTVFRAEHGEKISDKYLHAIDCRFPQEEGYWDRDEQFANITLWAAKGLQKQRRA